MPNIEKVLVANRGEIAIRIFRACYDLDIHTVAMYSAEDTYSLFRTRADEAYLVGEGKSPLGAYLDIPGIIDLAKRRGVSAIHPGYGFLSENEAFAKACEDNDILFIGPPSDVLGKMGDKLSAKEIAKACNVPTVPGCTEPLRDADEALEKAVSFGFPIILKAAAAVVCAAVTRRRRSSRPTSWCIPRRKRASAAATSSLKSSWSTPSTSRYRSWLTSTATSTTWVSVTAPCSAVIRRWWNTPRPGACRRTPSPPCAPTR